MTLVTRDPATGLRHSGIRHPNGQPPTPFGCRWCGTEQRGHGRRWKPGAGLHTWQRPTNAQIIARMTARRAARLNAAPPEYHALTRYSGTHSDPDDEGYALCADCGTDACPQYQRIQTRLARSWTSAAAQTAGSGWGGLDLPF